MKLPFSIALLSCALLLDPLSVIAQSPLGSAFTYQGQLKQNGSPANGSFSIDFKLWNDPTLSAPANQVGVTISLANVSVTNGLFSVPLDFGAVYNGDKRWLEIAVTGTTLSPRQELTATPYSRFSAAPWATSGNNITTVNTGNVGIGTASPTSKLDIAGTAKMTGMQLTTGAAAGRVLTSDAGGIGTWQSTGTYSAGSGLQLSGNVFSIANSGVNNFMLALDGASLNKVSGGAMNANGNFVGIGTSSPIGAAGFVVSQIATGFGGMYVNTSSATGMPFYGYAQGATVPAYHYVDGGDSNKWKLLNNGAVRLTVTNTGNVGIGTTSPAAKLDVVGSVQTTALQLAGNRTVLTGFDAGGFHWIGPTPDSDLALGVQRLAANNYTLHVSGTLRASVVEITGADLAERFEFSDEAAPGMVVAIDPERPGKLCVSRSAYNRCVAGVVSGANDLAAGVVLSKETVRGHPVALSGRVWVQCDARQTTVQPGDLLTSADRPGHAMPVLDHTRASGTILGKAMTRLDCGQTGMVLVLVNLQ